MAETHQMQNLLAELINQWNSAPDEIKQAAPTFITCANQTLITISTRNKEIVPLCNLATNLKHRNCMDQTAANNLIESCKNNVVTQNRENIFGALTEPTTDCSECVINELEKSMKDSANCLLGFAAASSFILLVFEILRLWNLWETIKEARNFVNVSIKNREKIATSLAKLPDEILLLDNFIAEITSGNNQEKIRVKATRQIDTIRRMLDRLEKEIRDLEVEVEKRKIRLGITKSQAGMSAFSGFVMTASAGAQIGMLANAASPWLIALNSVLAVGHLFISVANAGTYFITIKDIEKIQIELDEIAKLETVRKSLEDECNNKAEEAWEIIEEHANNTVNI